MWIISRQVACCPKKAWGKNSYWQGPLTNILEKGANICAECSVIVKAVVSAFLVLELVDPGIYIYNLSDWGSGRLSWIGHRLVRLSHQVIITNDRRLLETWILPFPPVGYVFKLFVNSVPSRCQSFWYRGTTTCKCATTQSSQAVVPVWGRQHLGSSFLRVLDQGILCLTAKSYIQVPSSNFLLRATTVLEAMKSIDYILAVCGLPCRPHLFIVQKLQQWNHVNDRIWCKGES